MPGYPLYRHSVLNGLGWGPGYQHLKKKLVLQRILISSQISALRVEKPSLHSFVDVVYFLLT